MKKIIFIVTIILIITTSFTFGKKVQPKDQNPGIISGTFPVYESASSVTITAGYGKCSQAYWQMDTDKTLPLAGSIPSGEDFLYIYIDFASVNSSSDNPAFYGSTTEPVYENFGWYKNKDRCIGVLWINSSGQIVNFQNNSRNEYIGIGPIKRVLENGSPGTSYKTLETTAYVPVNAIGIYIYARNIDADNTSVIMIAPFENTQSRLVNYSLKSWAATTGWLMLERGWSRDIKWYGADNDDNRFRIDFVGFRIER